MFAPPEMPRDRSAEEPQLLVAWEPRTGALWANLRVLFAPAPAQADLPEPLYTVRAAWFTPHFPARPMVISLLLHLLLVVVPLPSFGGKSRLPQRTLLAHHEIIWTSPSDILPPIAPLAPGKKKPAPRSKPKEALPPQAEETFHPRQRIISMPPKPNNKLLTLQQPDLISPPEVKPKPLPNIVLWARSPLPPVPYLELAVKKIAQPKLPLPAPKPAELPANLEPNIAPINVSSSAVENLRPKLLVPPSRTAASAPAEIPQAPAINLPTGEGSADRLPAAAGIIALSASPAPLAPVIEVPPGNLAAQFSVGPTGGRLGAPGASAAAGGTGNGAAAEAGGNGGDAAIKLADLMVSRAPGTPPGMIAGATGPGGEARPSSAAPGSSRPAPERRVLAYASLPPRGIAGREEIKPPPPGIEESILRGKKVYTLSINMPNLASRSGSWILRFSELKEDSEKSAGNDESGDLTGPVAVLKIDPKYSPEAVREHVEGQVVLYAIIRKDGKVEGVHVLRGLDARLDQNAVEALRRWEFVPAKKAGLPVNLEAVVFIPFRLTEAF